MKYQAFAKINLRLNVLGKNEFNYHNLSMLNAKISLADELEIIESTKNQVEYSEESLNSLAEIVSNYGGVIAVENLPRTCLGKNSAEILDLISANDKLKVCFDTNHLLVDTNLNFMEKLGDKIVTLHVSDYDFVNERHWLPGEGKNDWQGILEALKEINYDGIWLYEINMFRPLTTNFHDSVYTIFQNKSILQCYFVLIYLV